MIKKILLIIFLYVSSYAIDNLAAQKQNTLYVQNLIEIEESIAKNFEKYILTEFKIPELSDLITDDYLGSNFSIENKMGSDIAFEDAKELKIKYAITKKEYRKEIGKATNEDRNEDESSINQTYIVQLYNRDLYRNHTSVYDDGTLDSEDLFIEIILQSKEAKNIFELLKENFNINKECIDSLKSEYCNNKNNVKTFRWYNKDSKWIEYDKENYNNGHISTNMTKEELENEKDPRYPTDTGKRILDDLTFGSYIFIKNNKYIKAMKITNEVDPVTGEETKKETIQILEVD